MTHYGRAGAGIGIEPTMIVLHWTGAPSLDASWSTFDRETLPASRGDKDLRYRTRKTDPGDRFMRRVRERIRDLALTGAP